MIRVYAIIILAVLLTLSIGGGYWLYGKWRSADQQTKSVIAYNGKANKELEFYRSKNQMLVSVNESLVMEKETIARMHRDGQLAILDEFKGLKRDYRNLQNLINANLEIAGQAKFTITPTDTSTHDGTFNFQTPELNVSGSYKGDSVKANYIVNVPLSVVVYWKRKWFLGKKNYFVEATSANKNAKVTGLESIQVKKK